MIDTSSKKLNDVKGDEVVVIDGVEAEAVVEGEVEVYVDQGVIDTSSKNLNDVEDDEVVVIDGVEAEVKAMVEGEVEAKGQVDG